MFDLFLFLLFDDVQLEIDTHFIYSLIVLIEKNLVFLATKS